LTSSPPLRTGFLPKGNFMTDTGRAKLPALPRVNAQDPALRNWVTAVTERLEVREGSRGNPAERVVTQRELEDLMSKVHVLQSKPVAGPGETLIALGGGMSAAVSINAFAESLRNTRLYRDLLTRLDDPSRFHAINQYTRDVLTRSIAAEAAARGADIQRTEKILQTSNESLAMTVDELTAAVFDNWAGLRTVNAVFANKVTAESIQVTQLEASLGDYYLDGTPGRVALESSMTATADRVDGLAGEYMVKINAGNAVAGFGLAASEDPLGNTESSFIIQADTFAVVPPYNFSQEGAPSATIVGQMWYVPSTKVSYRATATGTAGWIPFTPKIPFGIDTTTGTIYIDGQVRINAGGTQLADVGAATDGKSTYAAPVYQRAASAPAAPATGTGTFNFGTNVLTPPAGWYVSPPAGTDQLYISTTTFSTVGQTATATAGTWSTPYISAQDGTPGTSTFLYSVFARAASAPASPANNTGAYNFGANTGTPPAGWSNTIPTGTDPIYAVTTMASISGATGTDSTLSWSTPVMMAQNGVDGINGSRSAVLDMYKWSASAPSTFPRGTSTYTWGTSQFTAPATLNGWALTPPAPVAGQTLYIARTVYADNGSSLTTDVTWGATSAIVLSSAGVNGVNGQRVGVLEVYKWAASIPTGYPSGTSTYTWSTGAFTAPSTANGWSLLPGAAVAGQTLWGISVSVSDNATTSTSTAYWLSSTVYAVGAAGTHGTRGSMTFYTTGSSWSDTTANNKVTAVTGSSTKIIGDTCTISNGSSYTGTKYWSGTAWVDPGVILDGNLLVTGTVSASTINSGTLAANNVTFSTEAGTLNFGNAVEEDYTVMKVQASTSTNWALYVGLGSTYLAGGTTFASKIFCNNLDALGTIRSTSQITPASGTGIEVLYTAGNGIIQAYDRSTNAYKALVLSGSLVTINGGTGLKVSDGFGCNTKSPQTAKATPANATDLATAIALVNNLKATLIANGIAS